MQILLYGSGCWQVAETGFHKFEAFNNGCLQNLSDFLANAILNLELHAKKNPSQFRQQLKGIVSSGSGIY